MADYNYFDYSNKMNSGYGLGSGFSSDSISQGAFTGSMGYPTVDFSSGGQNADAKVDIKNIKNVSSYVHNFFSGGDNAGGNEDFMSQMLKGYSPFFKFGDSYGLNNVKYNEKYDKSKFAPIVKAKAEKYGLDYKLVMALIQQESEFNPNATSPKGALGLMQLMPSTARQMGVSNAYDPEQNIEGGVKYLASLKNRYHGDMRKAVAAYNGGMGNVEKYGIDFCAETRNYHRKIMG